MLNFHSFLENNNLQFFQLKWIQISDFEISDLNN